LHGELEFCHFIRHDARNRFQTKLKIIMHQHIPKASDLPPGMWDCIVAGVVGQSHTGRALASSCSTH
jgi:hypothetical protein